MFSQLTLGHYFLSSSQYKIGPIDIIKRLSTVLSSVINKSQQHQEKKCRELSPGLLGEK